MSNGGAGEMIANETKTLVLHALRRGELPRFHGNGFIQLYLDKAKTMRFHVWHPNFKRIRNHNAFVHTHRFDMRSDILLGCLRQVTYDWLPYRKPWNMVSWSVGGVKHDTVFDDPQPGKLFLRNSYDIPAGGSYRQALGVYHDVYASRDEVTATMMTKTNVHPVLPRVVTEIDVPKEEITDAFRDDGPTTDDLILAIKEVLR